MDLLHRLHGSLATALTREEDSTARPLTIGDLYQRLIPYRTVRTELGVMELAAYEHLLLRLLGGEGEFIEVGSPAALEEFQRELASPNPILGIYRDYSDVPVTVRAPSGASVMGQPRASCSPAIVSDEAAGEPPPRKAEPRRPRPEVRRKPGIPTNAPQPRCRSCNQPLPVLTGLRFCPFCGENRPPEPCIHCGTPLELGWNFCIRCGQAVEDAV